MGLPLLPPSIGHAFFFTLSPGHVVETMAASSKVHFEANALNPHIHPLRGAQSDFGVLCRKPPSNSTTGKGSSGSSVFEKDLSFKNKRHLGSTQLMICIPAHVW